MLCTTYYVLGATCYVLCTKPSLNREALGFVRGTPYVVRVFSFTPNATLQIRCTGGHIPEGNAMRSCRRGLAHRESRPSRIFYRKRCVSFTDPQPSQTRHENGEKLVATNGTSPWRQPTKLEGFADRLPTFSLKCKGCRGEGGFPVTRCNHTQYSFAIFVNAAEPIWLVCVRRSESRGWTGRVRDALRRRAIRRTTSRTQVACGSLRRTASGVRTERALIDSMKLRRP
jgi:hypothetical protein